jgi:hypothetical protein
MVKSIGRFAPQKLAGPEKQKYFNDITTPTPNVRSPTFVDFALIKAQFVRLDWVKGAHRWQLVFRLPIPIAK